MTPTPEQVAQWAREAGCAEFAGMVLRCWPEQLHRLVTRAMAEQAEADAKLAKGELVNPITIADEAYNLACKHIEAAIRANAPKATT